MNPEAIAAARTRAREGLLQIQRPDGRWEGQLSSNLYPTLAVLALRHLEGEPLDAAALEWLRAWQLPDGRFPLDPERLPDDEATRLARVVLNAYAQHGADPRVQELLDRIPLRDWNHWIPQLFGALLGQREWEAFVPRGAGARMGVILGRLSRYLPRALFSRIKPPIRYAPPVDLFFTPAFGQLFPAEQYTLAPVFYLIEQHTSRRERVLEELIEWILARQDSEGSWFSVNFITALATLALRAAMEATPRPRLDRAYARAREWLEQTRNPDGGHREAADLNVWDTALSVLALLRSGMPARSAPIRRATDWLVSVQNLDGGWAFHGRRASDLLSDADDTALATWALLETGRHPVAAGRGVAWLADHQGKDGSWATYRPGVGDVGCVSVTARAIQVLAQVGERRRAERGLRWLRRVQANDGSWDDLWLARRTYGTAMALIAMARLDAFDRRTVERGLQWLLKHQRPDGGWGETQRGEPRSSTAEQTAFAVQALLAWGRSADRGLEWLLKHQRPDGGWDPAPIGIYWEVIGGYANPINGWVFPLLALSEEPEG